MTQEEKITELYSILETLGALFDNQIKSNYEAHKFVEAIIEDYANQMKKLTGVDREVTIERIKSIYERDKLIRQAEKLKPSDP